MKQWFLTLAPRERFMVVAGAIALVLMIFYYGLWHPLNSGLQDARARVVAEADQTRWLLGLREEARLLQASNRSGPVKGRNQSLLTIVDATSGSNGLGNAVRRIQPDGSDQATVTLNGANFNRMLYWLQLLRRDYGIHVSSLTVTREDTSGLVQARVTLKRSGA